MSTLFIQWKLVRFSQFISNAVILSLFCKIEWDDKIYHPIYNTIPSEYTAFSHK
jgi:hypothetical protein